MIDREMLIEETGEVLSCTTLDETDVDSIRAIDELAASVVWDVDKWASVLSDPDSNVIGVVCVNESYASLCGVVVFSAFRLVGGAVEKLIVDPSCNREVVAAFLFDEILKQFKRDRVHPAITYKIHHEDDEFENNESLIRGIGFSENLRDQKRTFTIFGKVKE